MTKKIKVITKLIYGFQDPVIVFLFLFAILGLLICGGQTTFENLQIVKNSELVSNYEKKVEITSISDDGEFTLKDGTVLKNIKVSIGPKLGYRFGQYMIDKNVFVEGSDLKDVCGPVIFYTLFSFAVFIFSIYMSLSVQKRKQYLILFFSMVFVFAFDLLTIQSFAYTFSYYKPSIAFSIMIGGFFLSLAKYFVVFSTTKKVYVEN